MSMLFTFLVWRWLLFLSRAVHYRLGHVNISLVSWSLSAVPIGPLGVCWALSCWWFCTFKMLWHYLLFRKSLLFAYPVRVGWQCSISEQTRNNAVAILKQSVLIAPLQLPSVSLWSVIYFWELHVFLRNVVQLACMYHESGGHAAGMFDSLVLCSIAVKASKTECSSIPMLVSSSSFHCIKICSFLFGRSSTHVVLAIVYDQI